MKQILIIIIALIISACTLTIPVVTPTQAPLPTRTVLVYVPLPTDTLPILATADVNVRSCPGITCVQVGWYLTGEVVPVMGCYGMWAVVPGGYLYSSYLTVSCPNP